MRKRANVLSGIGNVSSTAGAAGVMRPSIGARASTERTKPTLRPTARCTAGWTHGCAPARGGAEESSCGQSSSARGFCAWLKSGNKASNASARKTRHVGGLKELFKSSRPADRIRANAGETDKNGAEVVPRRNSLVGGGNVQSQACEAGAALLFGVSLRRLLLPQMCFESSWSFVA